MELDNKSLILAIQNKIDDLSAWLQNELITEPYYKDFAYRFCWNSNSIEGNTLSLDETIAVVDYDEVRSGHTYTEYTEAKSLYHVISTMLDKTGSHITEDWIQDVNAGILNKKRGYRQGNLYVGTLIEATYYPPDYEKVPELMRSYMKRLNRKEMSLSEYLGAIAEDHILFERIHPFSDGNGRTGRMILNQQLINWGLLPITIDNQSKYRQSFQRYDRGRDLSLLLHLICKGELNAIERVTELGQQLERNIEEQSKTAETNKSASVKKKIKSL